MKSENKVQSDDTTKAKLKGGPTLKPLGGMILIELFDDGGVEVTSGGIIVPETAETARMELRKRPLEGIVIALGKGKQREDGTRIPFEVSVGETVVFAKYAGNTYTYTDDKGNERKYILAFETDLLAAIVEE